MLLTAREASTRLIQPVFDFFPQAGFLQAGFNDFIQFILVLREAMNARTEGYIFINRLGERVGLLKNHTYLRTQRYYINLFTVDVFAIKQNFTGHSTTGYGVIHPVEASEKGGLAATGRTNHGKHLVLPKIY